ncbi:MAG: NHL repeat-containing protein [Acidobacteriaceae bacterium]
MAIKTGTAMFALAALSLGLAGCSGLQGSFPDVAAQNSVGSIRGSVYGGHAPIVGAHLFLLEATANGYATEAKSLLSASSTGTSSTYPVAEDTTTGSLTNGLYYITSDSNGAFNVTGDYTCDVGYPVYLYASAGSPGASSAISMTGISDTLSGGVYTYTFTAANMLYTGQSVQFSGASLGGEWATLNGTTQTVLATPTATSFKISTTTAPGSGANTSTGSATALGATNPAIVNLAMVGLCPGTGNFTNSVQSVYMNEVSTTAMAYAMSGFATDGLHIGTSSSNLIGLQNAALNAANLYNIQGGVYELAGNSAAGEGQIANQATPAGNGTAPQAELDTVANILAACVDSANTSTTTSAACNTLFTDATSTGTTSGTKPVNTAAAAFNMVHNPGATNVVDLWELPTGIVPFAPELTSAPKDFTAAITYTNLSAPGSIAIDASGDAFVPTNSTSGYVTKLSPQGAVLATSASGGSGFDSIAVAPNGNAYVAASGSNAVYRFTSALGAVSGSPWTSPTLSAPTSVIADSSSNVYVTDGGGNADIIRKFSSTGTLSASITNTCMNGVTQISLDASGYLWADSFANSSGCRLSNPSGTATFSLGESMLEPENVAVDSNGNGWVALESQNYIAEVTTGGSGAITNGGGLSSPTWVAIDGSNNIWVASNASPYALSEFNNAGTAITSCSGYQGGTLNTPSFLAIDASGDVWVPNKGSNSVTEIIGAATPVVTPLSAQKPGARP